MSPKRIYKTEKERRELVEKAEKIYHEAEDMTFANLAKRFGITPAYLYELRKQLGYPPIKRRRFFSP